MGVGVELARGVVVASVAGAVAVACVGVGLTGARLGRGRMNGLSLGTSMT
jgi:hypothetical protein